MLWLRNWTECNERVKQQRTTKRRWKSAKHEMANESTDERMHQDSEKKKKKKKCSIRRQSKWLHCHNGQMYCNLMSIIYTWAYYFGCLLFQAIILLFFFILVKPYNLIICMHIVFFCDWGILGFTFIAPFLFLLLSFDWTNAKSTEKNWMHREIQLLLRTSCIGIFPTTTTKSIWIIFKNKEIQIFTCMGHCWSRLFRHRYVALEIEKTKKIPCLISFDARTPSLYNYLLIIMDKMRQINLKYFFNQMMYNLQKRARVESF